MKGVSTVKTDLEKVCHAIEEDKGLFAGIGRKHFIVTEAHTDKNDRKEYKPHQLDRFSTP